MLTNKQRNMLRKEALGMQDIVHIGKDGMNENIIKQVKDALKARELIKGKIQQNSLEDAREVGNYLADKTGSDVVQIIGNKFILYKKNPDKNRYEL